MSEGRVFRILLILSLALAYAGWTAPSHTMPLDYGAIFSRSVPVAIAWGVLVVFGIFRYKMRGVWLLLGAPFALYWPIWMVFNHFPKCYYLHNCI